MVPTYSAHIHIDGYTWRVGEFATLEDAADALRNEGATGTLTRTGTKEHAFIPSGERIFVISEFDTDVPFNLSLDVPVPEDFLPAPKDFSDTLAHVYREPWTYKITGGDS